MGQEKDMEEKESKRDIEIKIDRISDDSDDESIEAQQPLRPMTESEFIREQMRQSRREWIARHRTVLYAAVGVVLAMLIFLGIRVYNSYNNPVTWLAQACAKDFDTSFDFDITLSEDGTPSMKYAGSVDFDRSEHTVQAVYDADYGSYTFKGALDADRSRAVKGSLYKDKWYVKDCTDQVKDFFSLDKSLKSGKLDGGALLRFLSLTSEFSSEEIERFSKQLSGLLSSNSTLSTVTASSEDGGTRYDFEIHTDELFRLIAEDGAPLFYHSSDYTAFKERYEANKRELEGKLCKMHYVINPKGYLTEFGIEIEADDVVYALDCDMFGFEEAKVELPAEFLKAEEEFIASEK